MTAPYIETAADAAFTLWLATRDRRTVLRERHAHLTGVEKQILTYKKRAAPKTPKPKPRPQFTREQISVALTALHNKETSK